jgi:hypothetical protein
VDFPGKVFNRVVRNIISTRARTLAIWTLAVALGGAGITWTQTGKNKGKNEGEGLSSVPTSLTTPCSIQQTRGIIGARCMALEDATFKAEQEGAYFHGQVEGVLDGSKVLCTFPDFKKKAVGQDGTIQATKPIPCERVK